VLLNPVGSEEMRPNISVHSFAFRNRSEFPITETELKLIAAAAIIGLSSNPKNG
jgi:hypothetical protein